MYLNIVVGAFYSGGIVIQGVVLPLLQRLQSKLNSAGTGNDLLCTYECRCHFSVFLNE